MRIVVTGSGGRLGAALVRELRQAHEVVGLDRAAMDLADGAAIQRVLGPLYFDVLINCAALTDVDYCESHPEEAHRVNADAVGDMARVASEKRARLVQVSTDYVFDGRNDAPCSEEDEPGPVNIYGEAKLAGERHATAGQNLIVRVSWIFGPDRPAFPEAILKRSMAGGALEAVEDKTSSPSYSVDLAVAVRRLLGAPEARGVFHLCNAGECSWREYAQAVVELAARAGLPLKSRAVAGMPLSSMRQFVAQRPLRTALATDRYRLLTGEKLRGWQEALCEYLQREVFPKWGSR